MTREAILAVVATHLASAVDGLDPTTVDGAQSMKHYGANSLDIVEVVSGSMRQLRVKVPRSELNKLADINGLVELLYNTSRATVPVAQ